SRRPSDWRPRARHRPARHPRYAVRGDSFPAGNRAGQIASSPSRDSLSPCSATVHSTWLILDVVGPVSRPEGALPGGRMLYTGEFAALGTAVCWASASNLFAAAGARVGSRVLNRLRLVVAWGFLTLALWVVHHTWWPTYATWPAILALAFSGMLGFVFG